jgi:hypothetical protein
MAMIAYALPIMPGQTESAGKFNEELDAAGLRSRYEELNRASGVTAHREWVAHLPMGDFLVVAFQSETPHLVPRQFGDNEYDNWWRARVERIHGFDPASGGGLPTLTHDWSDEP